MGSTVLAVVDDLLFSSKIRAMADRAGQVVVFSRDRAAVIPDILANAPRLVIIDLDRATLDPITTIREIRSRPDLADLKVVGYVSHVNTGRIEEARAAGIDLVLARSAFVAKLPDLLAPAPGVAPGTSGS